MKKILIYASLLATVSSCTQDELMNDSFTEQSKGISFSAVVPDALESRGELSFDASAQTFPFFWYAEQDKINIYAGGEVIPGDDNALGKGIVTDWASLPTAASYKATKSMANGDFTASSDEDLIEFGTDGTDEGETVDGTFVATYGATLTGAVADDNELTEITMTATKGNASLSTVFNIAEIAPMYSHTVKSQEKTYHSVGETVGLKFYRPLAVAGFTTSGIDEEYKEVFGNLTNVSITMLGNNMGTPLDSSDDIEASKISYVDGAVITVDLTDPFNASKTNVVTTGSTVAGTFNQEFGDGDVVYLPLANVDRKAFRDEEVKENYTVTYTFQNISFVVTEGLQTSNDWVSRANSILPVPALSMDNYPYLVVGNSAPYTLIVNSGEFDAIYGEDETMETIAWNGGTINATNVTKVISKVPANFEGLNLMTGVTELKLEVDTEIPAEGLNALTNLTKIELPAVTSVGEDAFDASLTEVHMGEYKFDEGLAINNMLLKKASLQKLTMGATNMNASFPANGLLLTEFTSLTEVTVKDGIKLGANSFMGCTSLEKVNGAVNIVGTGAFQDCEKLTTVTVNKKDVVDYTFSGCDLLTDVYYKEEGKVAVALKPNFVGQYAFQDTKVNLDLSETTIIAQGAFKNATSLVGYEWKSQNVVKVGATSIGVGAFSGATAIEFIYFLNATSIDNYMLSGTTALQEIKFGKPFVYGGEGKPAAGTLGANANIKLFIVEGQTGIAGNTLTIGPAGKTTTFSFLQIEEEAAE